MSETARAAEYLLSERGGSLASDVHRPPRELHREIASLKLAGMGIQIDVPTDVREQYLGSWDQGT